MCAAASYGRRTVRSQAGQATLEWVGLVLLAALVLGGLAAFAAPVADRGLGTAVAQRITCAARGGCAGRGGAGSDAATDASGRLHGTACGGSAPAGGAGAARAPAALAARLPALAIGSPARDRLRGVANAGKRLWILCVGWGRFVYERDHPRAPNEAMPLDEVVEIADSCFNPLGFLGIG